MSGSRRNRMLNLNTPVESRLPVRQIQQSEALVQQGSAVIQYPPGYAVGMPQMQRPMVIQYGNPNPNPNPASTLPHQTRQTVSTQFSTPTNLPPPVSPTFQRKSPTNEPYIMDRLATAINPALNAHQESTAAEIRKVQGLTEKVAADVKEYKDDNQKQITKIVEAMHTAFLQQQAGNRQLNSRMEKVEKLIMAAFDRDDKESLLSRIENIQYSLGDLSERAKDPSAPVLTDAPQIDLVASNGVQTTPAPEAATENVSSAVQRTYGDKSTVCDIVDTLPERTTSPIQPVYADAANDAMDLEPEIPSSATEIMILPQYTSVGNDPRTPSRRFSSEDFLHSSADVPRMVTAASRQYLSDATTIVDNGYRKSRTPVDDMGKGFKSHDAMVVDGEVSEESEDALSLPGFDEITTNEEVHVDTSSAVEPDNDSVPTQQSNSRSSDEVVPMEGSVATLRQAVISASASASPLSVVQNLPLLPSPAKTRSAPTSPEPAPTSSSPYVPVAHLRQNKPKKMLVVVSSPSSGSTSGIEGQLPSSLNHETSTIPLPRTPRTKPFRHLDAQPDSEDESELSVIRIIAAQTSETSGENVPLSPEVPYPDPEPARAVVQRATPLFLPGSRSESPPVPIDEMGYEFSPPVPSPQSPKRFPVKVLRPITPVTKTPVAVITSNDFRKGGRAASIKQSPSKAPTMARSRPKARALPSLPSPELIAINTSPIYISSRSPSPLSDISSDSDSDAVRIVRRKSFRHSIKNERASATSIGAGSSRSDNAARRIDLSEKLKAKKGESAAVTRVKKRKASLGSMEPPLKRARQRMDEGDTIRVKRERKSIGGLIGKGKDRDKEMDGEYRVKTKPKSVSPTKERKKLRQRPIPTGCAWPQKNLSGDKKFDHQFIECEKCYMWYHYGCIGITDLHDPIVKGDVSFICPPCKGGGANPMVSSKKVNCGRPDCGQEEKQPDEYFMTAIIGRHTKVQGGTGRKYMWLVKWDGYSIKDCTWEAEDGMSDPQTFIDDFNEVATKEGKDPDEDPHSTILLREAIVGGWKDPNV